jgi:hypothetical protein
MRKFAILGLLLALELGLGSCGSHTPPGTVVTTTSGNWEAQLAGGTGLATGLNFVTTFRVTNTSGGSAEPLVITGLSFFNAGSCFAVAHDATTENGTATLNVTSAGQVTGTMTLDITSNTSGSVTGGNVLSLTTTNPQGFTATFTGTTPTAGNINNGVVVGSWTLSGPCAGGANPTGTFVMCQASTTCTPPS